MTSTIESKPEWEGRVLPSNAVGLLPHEVREQELDPGWSGISFWFRWVLITTLGWLVGGAAVGAVAGLTGSVESVPARAANYSLVFITIVLQWLVLRRPMPRAWRWIPITTAGDALSLLLAFGAQFALRQAMGQEYTPVELGAVAFLSTFPTVVVQWFLLRTIAQRSWRWFLANLLWIVPVTLLSAFRGPPESVTPSTETAIAAALAFGINGGLLGLFVSVVIASELLWLLRHPKVRPSAAPVSEAASAG